MILSGTFLMFSMTMILERLNLKNSCLRSRSPLAEVWKKDSIGRFGSMTLVREFSTLGRFYLLGVFDFGEF